MMTRIRPLLRGAALLICVAMGFASIVATSGDSAGTTDTTVPESGIIYMPQDGAVYVEGDTVSFISKLSNLDATETYTYSWVSSLDGEIGTTAAVSTATLTAGVHDIIFTVTDSTGNTVVTDAVTITVGESSTTVTNTSPVAAITAPADDMSFNVGETVTFQGTGTDAEDGALTDSALVWSSSIDGAVGTGSPLSVATLAQGEHTITLTVTDSDGAVSNAFVIITVGSASSSPMVTITSPGADA